MHFWVLKSFWRERKIYDDDVEFHGFAEIATEPAMRPEDISDPLIVRAVKEIDEFYAEFIRVYNSNDHDLDEFWLRKTKKPVLAVLLVEKNGSIVAHRGTNLEVSLPTGSLCAERNAIGSALASDLSLKRQDIKLVAVYSASLEPSMGGSTPDRRDRGDSFSVLPISEYAAAAGAEYPTDLNSSISVSLSQSNLQHSLNEHSADGINSPLKLSRSTSLKHRSILTMQTATQESKVVAEDTLSLSQGATNGFNSMNPPNAVQKSPKRKNSFGLVNSSNGASSGVKKRRKSVPFSTPAPSRMNSNQTSSYSQSVDENDTLLCMESSSNVIPLIGAAQVPRMETIWTTDNDLNPLKPCGACQSWLQKIAKINPDLRVVTFTDASRKGIYVEYVQD